MAKKSAKRRPPETRGKAKPPQVPKKRPLSPLVRGVIADAKIASEGAKQIFGEALDLAINQIRLLRKKQTTGTILVDEARSIPALMSNIKRTLDAIGVTTVSDEDPEGDL